MNSRIILGLFTLTTFATSIHCKVNITSVKPLYFNPEYLSKSIKEIISLKKDHSGFTDLQLQLDVIKDFPVETVLISKLFISKCENGPWQEVQTYVSQICDLNDEYRNFLPPFLIELTKAGKCVQKGKYYFADAGQFQFDKLFTAESLKGWYFNVKNQIRTADDGVCIRHIEIKSKA